MSPTKQSLNPNQKKHPKMGAFSDIFKASLKAVLNTAMPLLNK